MTSHQQRWWLPRWMLLLALPALLLLPSSAEASPNSFIELSEYVKFPKVYAYDDFEDCRREYRDDYVYCVVHAQITPDDSSELYRNLTIFSQDTLHFDHSRLERGLCIQDCLNALNVSGSPLARSPTSERSYAQLAQACIDAEISRRYGLHVEPKVDIYHCYTNENENPSVDLLEVSFYILAIVLVALLVASTIYDLRLMPRRNAPEDYFSQSPKLDRDRLLVSFSIPRNLQRLKEPTEGAIRKDLLFLEAFRVIQMFRVVFLHVTVAQIKVPQTNTEYIEGVQHSPATIVYIAEFQNYVQTFLSISGMLLTINFLEFIRKNPEYRLYIFWDKLKGRLCRVFPSYAFVILLECALMKRLMDGPIGQQFIGEAQENCRRWWWANLLFINNYIRTDQPCLIQSWYVAVDMQLFIYGMVAMMLIWRWPSLQKYIFGLAFVSAVVIPTLTNYFEGIVPAMTMLLKNANHYNREHTYQYGMYFPFHQNIGIYTLGMLAGVIYHEFRTSRKELLHSGAFRKIFIGAFILNAFALTLVYWMIVYQSEIPPLLSAIYSMIFRQSWGILSTVIQLAMSLMAFNSLPKRFFSHSFFAVGGKLCFGIFMIHFTVIELVYGGVKAPIVGSERIISTLMAQVLFWTLMFGIGLTVMVELPWSAALKEILDRRKVKPTESVVHHMPNGVAKVPQ